MYTRYTHMYCRMDDMTFGCMSISGDINSPIKNADQGVKEMGHIGGEGRGEGEGEWREGRGRIGK